MSKGSTRILTIVVIIALFVGAWYTLINNSAQNANQYKNYLQTAREKKDLGLNDDAADFYRMALETKDSMALRIEIAEFFRSIGKINDYVASCDSMIENYPFEEEGYVRMTDYFIEKKDYGSTFKLINKAISRGVESPKLIEKRESIKYEYEYIGLGFENVKQFSGGLAAAKKYDGKWGYVTSSGKRQLSFRYNYAESFSSSSLAAVQYDDGTFKIIDITGRDKHVDAEKKAIEECTYLLEDKIAVKYNGKFHYCDIDFKELFGSYDYAGTFINGIAAVMNDGKWFFIKSNGEKLNDKVYEEIVVNDKGIAFNNNVAFVKTNGKYILIDQSGNQIGSESWAAVDAFNSNQPAAVSNGSRWGFVNVEGKMVTEYAYENAKSFSNGFAAVANQGLWGYIISSDNSLKIDYAFKEANDFGNAGSAFVMKDNGWDLIRLYSYKQ